MILPRNEILSKFTAPVYVPHPAYTGYDTFPAIDKWPEKGIVVELPRLRIEIHSVEYIRGAAQAAATTSQSLRFQQDTFRLWYQIDGMGILHNASRNQSGSARPGLLGIMERGERHTYLHQKGTFECFTMLFSLKPSQHVKCCWSSTIGGKRVLAESEKLFFENHVFEMLYAIASGHDATGVLSATHCMELLLFLFSANIITVEAGQFPKSKTKFLVAKARDYMDSHYADMHHQNGLAAECGVNINYLNIRFKEETGQTLYDYLTKIRLEHAKYLLEDGTLSVTDIASRVGYPNANSFARIFKNVVHKSPTAYTEEFQHTINKRS
jgi:AraC-like DNA-binding protein